MSDDEKQETYEEFGDLVNMTPKELEDWLGTDDSKSVGQKDGGGESTGHEMGRRIVEIKHTKKADLSDDDYEAMRKVCGYVKRHTAQGPEKEADKKESDWRYSLMNWGHDPLK